MIDEFFADDVPGLAAQLTFYLITAFFPFLILVFTIVSYTPLLSPNVLFNILSVLPEQTYNLIVDTLTGITRSVPILVVSCIIGIWSMSSAMSTLAKALNQFYDVKENRNFIMIRIWGILFALFIIISMLANLILLVFGTIIGQFIERYFPNSAFLWNVLRIGISFVLMAVLFAFVYKVMPNRHLRMRSVAVGALFSAFAWGAVSAVFSYYVNNFASYHIIYGSIGGIIALITWLFITSYVILIGGDLNAVLSGYRRRMRQEKLEE